MWRTDSLEKTLKLGKIEGKGRRGRQRMRWLDGITYSVGCELKQTLGNSEGQGNLACCSPWGCKESDMTLWLNSNNNKPLLRRYPVPGSVLILLHVDLFRVHNIIVNTGIQTDTPYQKQLLCMCFCMLVSLCVCLCVCVEKSCVVNRNPEIKLKVTINYSLPLWVSFPTDWLSSLLSFQRLMLPLMPANRCSQSLPLTSSSLSVPHTSLMKMRTVSPGVGRDGGGQRVRGPWAGNQGSWPTLHVCTRFCRAYEHSHPRENQATRSSADSPF